MIYKKNKRKGLKYIKSKRINILNKDIFVLTCRRINNFIPYIIIENQSTYGYNKKSKKIYMRLFHKCNNLKQNTIQISIIFFIYF